MPEPISAKLGMYIMVPEPISTAYSINPSNQSVCLYVYPRLLMLGNGSLHMFPRQRRIVGHVVLYAVRVVSKESLWVSLCILLSLLGNGSVNTFPLKRWIVGHVVFYAVHVVSNERRR
jgi:hypothetical protein